MRIVFSEASAHDLRSIHAYSEEQWGQDRAARYMLAIDDVIQQLALKRLHGRPSEHMQPGLRRVLAGRHHIYFKFQTNTLHISRVLHGSMNIE